MSNYHQHMEEHLSIMSNSSTFTSQMSFMTTASSITEDVPTVLQTMHQRTWKNNETFGWNSSNMSNISYYPEIVRDDWPMYMFVYVTMFNLLIFVIGVLGNVMVIHVVARMKAMRTQMNFFLMSLSAADLFVLVICQPSALLEFYGKDRWLLGDVMCRLVPLLENASLHSSVLTLLTIGFERYYTICHPLKDQNTCLLTSTGVFVTCIWGLALILSLPFVFLTSLEDATFFDKSTVQVCRTKMINSLPRIYIVSIFCIVFILPMCMLTYMYFSIIQKLFRLNSERSPRDYTHRKTIRSRKQVVRMLIAIVILFFVSLLPIRIMGLWIVFAPAKDQEALGFETYQNIFQTSRILGYVNSAGNPIIYGLVSSKFRSAFRRSLTKCLPSTENRDSYTPRTTPREHLGHPRRI